MGRTMYRKLFEFFGEDDDDNGIGGLDSERHLEYKLIAGPNKTIIVKQAELLALANHLWGNSWEGEEGITALTIEVDRDKVDAHYCNNEKWEHPNGWTHKNMVARTKRIVVSFEVSGLVA